MDPPASTAPYARLQLPDLDSVPSYKYWAICNILCCCLPLGLVAVYYSGQGEPPPAFAPFAEAQDQRCALSRDLTKLPLPCRQLPGSNV
ncbi:hypothetical protein UY3_15373 [Chelonia mydas]|uniref:Uncharacterized protein n=1 Tax=Chelonia mydas TaxID=8469 RepID=M7AQF3_CHEMY|nr:hypothetical protein UY3_15373 [Chelonia mydas]